ncbi:expressed unknown protein [Seminavis robusta]|uniref:Uncharacterized protein n=1 Tax=Seminavis robusta TaxID=568900 RepID=A0A9N8D7J6_9STRA|nr:expressed unknown protein [Seminavis robusta]|eukprot:Sro8_g006490.1 n/a (422) ;mRNA; r:15755-17157
MISNQSLDAFMDRLMAEDDIELEPMSMELEMQNELPDLPNPNLKMLDTNGTGITPNSHDASLVNLFLQPHLESQQQLSVPSVMSSSTLPAGIVCTVTPEGNHNNFSPPSSIMELHGAPMEEETQEFVISPLLQASSLFETTIPEGKPVVPQIHLLGPQGTLVNSDSMEFVQETTNNSLPVFASTNPPAPLAATVPAIPEEGTGILPSEPKRKRGHHRRAVTKGSFDFLYRQQELEHRQQAAAAAVESEFGPMEPPKHDPLNVMAHSFLKQEQLRLTVQDANPEPMPSAAIPDPLDFLNPTTASSTVPPAVGAPAPTVTHSNVIVLDQEDDNQNPTVKPTASATQTDAAPQQGPSRLSRFLDHLQAQADAHAAMLVRQQQEQHGGQPSNRNKRQRHRRVVSDMGPQHVPLFSFDDVMIAMND